VEPLKETKTSAVYRLHLSDGTRVVAKRGEADRIAAEHAVYLVLRELPVRTPAMFGLVADDGSGRGWVFTEDAGGVKVRDGIPEHRRLLTAWLAALHASAASSPLVVSLPLRGAAYYLEALEDMLASVDEMLSKRRFTTPARDVLMAVLERGEVLTRNWLSLLELCTGLPDTLVHGDLTKKNLRVSATADGLELLAVDWESAGFGLAAVDLARVDPALYAAAVQETWHDVSAPMVRRTALGGWFLRLVLALSWAAHRLPYPSIERPIAQMETYVASLDDRLAAAGFR
jgi:Ser/Thr protein kinase RdoA (MazF antagonist)